MRKRQAHKRKYSENKRLDIYNESQLTEKYFCIFYNTFYFLSLELLCLYVCRFAFFVLVILMEKYNLKNTI